MKYKNLLFSLLCFLPAALHAQCQQPVLLNNWTAQGGNWNVNPNNISVVQTLNGGDVYFLSPDNYINVLLSGNLKTNDSDDDIMGFVFGVEGTIGTAPYHCYRFQWDEGDKCNGMYIQELSQNGTTALYSNPGNYWTRGFNHSFTITYKSTYIEVYVDGNFKTKILGCFNPGKFGFYNYSQAQVTYSNFTYKVLADFTVNDSLCEGENTNFNIFCNNNTVHNYSSILWDLGDGTIVNDSIKFSHQYPQPGTYSVKLTVSDAFGCVDSTIKQVTVHPGPSAIFSSTNVCLNMPVAFTDNSAISSSTITGWNWDFTSDGTVDNITQNPDYTYATCGNFNAKLVVTSAKGCKDSVSQLVTVNCLPTANYSTIPVCESQATMFNDLSLGTIAAWNWDFGDAGNSIAQSPGYTYATCGTFNNKLVVTTDQGCKDSITKSVIVNCSPVANFSSVDVCQNQAINFNDSSTIVNAAISDWSWDFGDGTALNNTQNPVYTYASYGSNSVTLIVAGNNGCIDTVAKTVVVHPLPTALFSTVNVCDGNNVQFNDMSGIPANTTNDVIQYWIWGFGDGSPLNTNQNSSHLYTTAGSYTVQLLTVSSFGCADSISGTSTVNPNPVVNFTAADTTGCAPLCTVFQDLSTLTSIAAWDLGDGSPIGNLSSFEHCYTNDSVNLPLSFNVTLTVSSDSGCVSSLTKNNYIVIYPTPNAGFTVDQQTSTIIDPIFTVTDSSTGANYWNWNFGDGSAGYTLTSAGLPQSYTYTDTGKFIITLITSTQYSCADTAYETISIESDFVFYIPNSFTPDGDGINDNFTGKGIFIKALDMMIFDRWGNLIYKTDNMNEPWNGSANRSSEIAPADVYVYSINVTDFTNRKRNFKGIVTLVR